jgi:hypothetical protein
MNAVIPVHHEMLIQKMISLVSTGKDRASRVVSLLCSELHAETGAFFAGAQNDTYYWVAGNEDQDLVDGNSRAGGSANNLLAICDFALDDEEQIGGRIVLRFSDIECANQFNSLCDQLSPFFSIILRTSL